MDGELKFNGAESYNPYKPNDPNYEAWNRKFNSIKNSTEKLLFLQAGKKASLDVAGGVTSQPVKDIKLDNAGFNGLRQVDAQVKYDDEGRPIRNPYTAMTDASGNLLRQFSMGDKIGADIQLDRTGLNEIQKRALSTGPSAWATMAEQKQRLEQGNAINQAQRSAQANTNRGFNMLASRGGLSAGQRERLAMQGNRSAFQGTQNINNQGLLARMNIGLQDQQQKDSLLTQLPGMQMNAANFDQSQRAYRNQATAADIGNSMKDIQGYNAYNANAFDKAMQEWGANKQADAQARASSGGGGGLLSSIFG